MRTKAEFKALREMVGMTQQHLADELGVEVRSVKRWEKENAKGYYNPPDEAWDILIDAFERQRDIVSYIVNEMFDEMERRDAEPDDIAISYWLSEMEYQTYSVDAQNGISGNARMANANARAVAAALMSNNIDFRFVNGVTQPARPDC